MHKPSAIVGWHFTALSAVVMGMPIAIVAAEAILEGRAYGPRVLVALGAFGIAWLLLLATWLVLGDRNRGRARCAWYSLVASLVLMAFVVTRPYLQVG
jgi:hypothetical protein